MSAGTDFRAAVEAEFEDPDLMYGTLLDQACSVLEVIERLEAQIAQDGDTVQGSRGQLVVHPAFAEVRQQRLVLSRLMRELDLTVSVTTAQAKKAAKARWQGNGR